MSSPTARRAVLTVATDPYVPLQQRLLRSLGGFPALAWTGALPPGSPAHADVPYAFKLHAVRAAAARGVTSVLWLDSPCVAARPPGPVFDRIEREGHLFVSGHDRLGNWASDACLAAFGLSRDEAMDLPLLNGTFLGLDLLHARTRLWFDELCRHERLLAGAYLNAHAPAEVRARKPGKPLGTVSPDPRCWGHRHDEAVGTCLALRMGLAISPPADLLANGTPDLLAPFRYLPPT